MKPVVAGSNLFYKAIAFARMSVSDNCPELVVSVGTRHGLRSDLRVDIPALPSECRIQTQKSQYVTESCWTQFLKAEYKHQNWGQYG